MRWIFPGLVLVDLLLPTSAIADGSLPPLPYRYLRPPAALAQGNTQPVAGIRVLPLDYLRGVGWGAFTPDTQAGITGQKNAFNVSSTATAVVVRIDPVQVPGGLPPQAAPDGNAYRFTATEQPGVRTPTLRRPVNLVFRWPHIPVAIYVFRHGKWSQLCYADNAYLTPNTIECATSSLGIFLPVANPATVGVNFPSTPASSLNPYIPALAALILLIAAIVVGYLVTRPHPKEKVK